MKVQVQSLSLKCFHFCDFPYVTEMNEFLSHVRPQITPPILHYHTSPSSSPCISIGFALIFKPPTIMLQDERRLRVTATSWAFFKNPSQSFSLSLTA